MHDFQSGEKPRGKIGSASCGRLHDQSLQKQGFLRMPQVTSNKKATGQPKQIGKSFNVTGKLMLIV